MQNKNAEKQLEKMLPTEEELHLLSLLLGEEIAAGTLRMLTDDLDLDTADQNYLLMLSCLGHTKGWDHFPKEMVPRLKGIHRYHQVHNAMGLAWLVQQLRRLEDAGIPVMLLKGGAMLTYYLPGVPRFMWDYDVAVPEKRFDEALHLLLTEENTLGVKAAHSVSVKAPHDEIDLHRWIFKTKGERSSDIWERAIPFDLHGVTVCVPAAEDMLIHLMDNQSRNFFREESTERRMQWIYDCRCICGKTGGLDLKALAERAEVFHATARVRMMLLSLMQCFPNLIDQKAFKKYFPWTKTYSDLIVSGMRFQKQNRKYRSFHYSLGGPLTIARFLRTLQNNFAEYRYLKPELYWMEPRASFARYQRMIHPINSFSDLSKGYLSRIRLTGR